MTFVVMGFNDTTACREGWYALERDGRNGVACRWTQYPDAVIEFTTESALSEIVLFVCGAPECMNVNAQVVEVCDEQSREILGSAEVCGDLWQVCNVRLSRTLVAGRHRLVLHLSGDVYVPDRWLGNGDCRQMGIRIGGVRAN
ncbi:MAG: hypothetical protein PHX74_05445 [Candidatus Sumerlaeales bacterium]|nr:hypothetical protein [Candidatus Sumerlaeales bacterium]